MNSYAQLVQTTKKVISTNKHLERIDAEVSRPDNYFKLVYLLVRLGSIVNAEQRKHLDIQPGSPIHSALKKYLEFPIYNPDNKICSYLMRRQLVAGPCLEQVAGYFGMDKCSGKRLVLANKIVCPYCSLRRGETDVFDYYESYVLDNVKSCKELFFSKSIVTAWLEILSKQ